MKTQQQRKESKERENEKEKDKLGNCVIHSRETNAKGEGDRKNREVGVPELFVRSIVRLFIRSLARETERGRLGLGLVYTEWALNIYICMYGKRNALNLAAILSFLSNTRALRMYIIIHMYAYT